MRWTDAQLLIIPENCWSRNTVNPSFWKMRVTAIKMMKEREIVTYVRATLKE